MTELIVGALVLPAIVAAGRLLYQHFKPRKQAWYEDVDEKLKDFEEFLDRILTVEKSVDAFEYKLRGQWEIHKETTSRLEDHLRDISEKIDRLIERFFNPKVS